MRLHKTGRAVAAMAAVAAGVLALSSCTTGGSGASGTGGETDTIRTAMLADPNSFDPVRLAGVSAYQAASLLFGTLVYQDEDGALAPGIAGEFDITDPKHQEYTIRDGLSCADGTPITATIVKDSLENFAQNSRQKSLAFGPSMPTFTADDATTKVTVDLQTGWANAPRGLSMVEAGIVCPAGLKDKEGLGQGTVEGAFSGPYALTENKPGASVNFTLRDNGYVFPEYAAELPGRPAKKIDYTVNGDQNAVVNGLLSDTYDVATVSGDPMKRFDGKDGFATDRYPAATLYLVFNQRKGAMMADRDMRVAVARAMNRKTFAQTVGGGLSPVLNSFATDDVECAAGDDSTIIKPDPAAAKKALAGKTIRTIGNQIIGPNGAGSSYVAQAMESVGAKVSSKMVDNTTWETEVVKDSWDVTVMSDLNLSRTMPGGLNPFTGVTVDDGGRNVTGDAHQGIVDKNLEAMATGDADKRCGIYREIQADIDKDAVVVPLSAIMTQVTAEEGFSSPRINGSVPALAMRITD